MDKVFHVILSGVDIEILYKRGHESSSKYRRDILAKPTDSDEARSPLYQCKHKKVEGILICITYIYIYIYICISISTFFRFLCHYSEALVGACDRRGIDLGRVDVLLDAFSTPLPILTTETSCLGGKHLRVTGKSRP